MNVKISGKWSLFAGNSVETINLSTPILKGKNDGTFILNVSDSTRSYFFLKVEKGGVILAERHLPMTGGYIILEIWEGCFKTATRKYIRWGKVFRSDELQKLTDSDLQYLTSIPLTSIIDFRSLDEIDQAPDKLPDSSKSYILSINPGSLASSSVKEVMSLPNIQADNFMIDMNKSFSQDNASVKQYKAYFELLQNNKNSPLLFHCSAGKDRTGMGAALFLFSLGVEEDIIMDDYLASNVYLNGKYLQYISQYPSLKLLFEVNTDFLKVGINQIKKDYGSVENFLVKILKVDIQKIIELYLF